MNNLRYRWNMFLMGMEQADKIDLTKMKNWTPVYYYLAYSYLVFGFFIGILLTILIIALIGIFKIYFF